MFGKNKKKEVDLEELRNEQNYQYSNQQGFQQQNQYANEFYQNNNYNNQYANQQQNINNSYNNFNDNQNNNHKKKEKRVKTEEDRFKSKLIKRYFLRAILICLNIFLIGYFVFEITLLIKNEVNKNNLKKEAYISLCSGSKKKSEELYAKYELDGYKSVVDYSLIGTNLFLSNNRVDAENLSSFSTLQLSNVCSTTDKVAFVDSLKYSITNSDFNSGINLSSLALEPGDYFVYDRGEENKSYPLKISNTNLSVSYYSLPNENGERNKISLLNTTESRALVIRVEKVSSVINDYYDLVIATTNSSLTISESLKPYKIKVIYNESTADLIKESSLINAPRAVLIDDNEGKVKSFYNKNDELTSKGFVDSSTITNGKLSGYDSDDFIREMSGYIQNAGSCYLYNEYNTCSVKQNTVGHLGKIAYHIGLSSDIESELTNILF